MTRRQALTAAQVTEIRAMYQRGKVGYETIARKFGVGASTVRDIIQRYTQYSARI